MKMNMGIKIGLFAIFSMSAMGFADDLSHAGASAQVPAVSGTTRPAPSDGQEFLMTKNGKKLYLTGTEESRQLEAKKAIEDFARSKGKNIDTLSEKETEKLTLQAVKEGTLSINALGSLATAASIGLLFANDADTMAEQKPEDREKLLKAKPYLKDLVRATHAKLDPDMSDADLDKVLAELDKPNHFGQELGGAIGSGIGEAIAKGLAEGITQGLSKMIQAGFDGILSQLNMLVDLTKKLNAPKP